jgi:hypothetical protein
MLTIACVLKTSDIYNQEWVYKLKRAVERNISLPFQFVCVSDVPLDCNYVLLENNSTGWWNKLQLFRPGLFTDETLYFDLDVVISKSLDALIVQLRNQSSKFVMCREEPLGISNSSIMYWKGDYSYLYNLYMKSPETYHNLYRKGNLIGDQALISENTDHTFINDHLPNNFIYWIKNKKLVTLSETGLVIFLSNKSKPYMFQSHPHVLAHWI